MDTPARTEYLPSMRFEDLIAPMSAEEFLRDHYGRRPLHSPAGDGAARRLIGWDRLNELLALRSHWNEANIKLMLNGAPIAADLYIDSVATLGGTVRRADPARLDVFLQMGASLVAEAVHEISPEVRALAASLSQRFAGRAEANVYCSFKGIQAFASHFDTHEVFAIQCEGEKMWNLYENRAEAPVEPLEGADAQAMIDSAKGRVAMQVRMHPGDMLYIPRGFYHDALASSGASLHVTFSVTPLNGRALFRMLEEEAIIDPAFREYLPDARSRGGAELAERLASLGERIAAILASPRFAAELGDRQRRLFERNPVFTLPERRRLDFYARTPQPAEIRREGGETLLRSAGRSLPLGALAQAAEWILGQAGFSLQQLAATHPHLDQAGLEGLVRRLEQLGLLFPFEPEV